MELIGASAARFGAVDASAAVWARDGRRLQNIVGERPVLAAAAAAATAKVARIAATAAATVGEPQMSEKVHVFLQRELSICEHQRKKMDARAKSIPRYVFSERVVYCTKKSEWVRRHGTFDALPSHGRVLLLQRPHASHAVLACAARVGALQRSM